MNRRLAVSLHDVAPATWPLCRQLLALTDRHGLPVTLLVVPRFHSGAWADTPADFVMALKARLQQGDEIVLHGYQHHDDGPDPRTLPEWFHRRVLTASEGEFSALTADEASVRLEAGLTCFARMGIEPVGFVPPAWQLSAGSWAALRTLGLRYTCTRDRLLSLRDHRTVDAPSLVWSTRSLWRRALSRVWNEQRHRRLRESPLVRVALHPAEGRFPSVMRHWDRLLGELTAERSAVLESDYLATHGH